MKSCSQTVPHVRKVRAANERPGLIAFVTIAFAVSWACWIPAAWSDAGLTVAWVQWLSYAGTLGPAVAGIALVYFTYDTADRANYWARVTDLSRIRLRSAPIILLLYPVATVVGLFCDSAVTHVAPNLHLATRLLSTPASLAVFMLWVLLLGPVPEELGWRGYALDQLQCRWSAVASSLILGVIWAAWHLPLFFIKGTYQHGLAFGSLSFLAYCVTVIELSIFFTWIHNENDRSILAAILFHFVLNFTGSLLRGSAITEVVRALLLGVGAGYLACVTWPAARALRRSDQR